MGAGAGAQKITTDGQEKMMESAQKLFAKMYEQTQQAGGQAGPNPGAGAAQGGNEAGYGDDVVDADYKEV